MEMAKAVNTPGSKDALAEEDEEKLNLEESTSYRRTTAIINYIAQDRPDLNYAIKECARGMSAPTRGDLTKIKRVLRYLRQAPVRRQLFAWQNPPPFISVYTDADWAGFTRSRRSISVGVCMLGSHKIKSWSRTQASVALSSAESELYAAVKVSTGALGLIPTASELNMTLKATVLLDSSAAQGIISRQGNGKVKHIRTQQLWVQEAAADGRLSYKKIPRDMNLADLLTHHWGAVPGGRMLQTMGFV